jgi:hypothetical protein
MDSESTLTIDSSKTKRWKNKKGKFHRLDGPAVEYPSGAKEWFQNGKIHRLDGPARERTNGTKEWWQNGKRHRLDGPAVVFLEGIKQWWLNDILYKTKEEYFDALSGEAKAKCLFSEDFLNG